MTIFALRIFMFTILPLLFAGAQIWLDKSTNSRDRRLEVVLIYLFALSVAGSGIGNFFAHFFLSDLVAESIGWPAGSPFQLEVAFANLAMGLMGILAVSRRDGAREATVIAVTVFSLGATVVHLMDIAATGNLAPGNETVLQPGDQVGHGEGLTRPGHPEQHRVLLPRADPRLQVLQGGGLIAGGILGALGGAAVGAGYRMVKGDQQPAVTGQHIFQSRHPGR